jgi:dolichyl-phosphate-mannose--protein O-mannosyl transferase
MKRPIWYYDGPDLASGVKASIVSFGNPLVWWVGIPCFFAAFFFAYKKRDKYMGLVLTAFIFQYAPWVLVARSTYIYHYFSSVPFVIFFIVYTIKNLLEAKVINKVAVYVYLAAALALFALYYPVLSGLEVPVRYADALQLFSSWTW